eukprot:COSAG01_NODE_1467_length_10217_cov_33.824570_16_plen_211_part_00
MDPSVICDDGSGCTGPRVLPQQSRSSLGQGPIALATTVVACCLIGAIVLLWYLERIYQTISSLSGSNTRPTSFRHVIFGSMRFPPPPEAIQLQQALRQEGVDLMIIDMKAGNDIDTEVFTSIEEAETFLVFGTSRYGEDTGNQASTFYESKYAHKANKRIILLRMIPFEKEFEQLQARVMFGMNKLELAWLPGEDMPTTLVHDILGAIDL